MSAIPTGEQLGQDGVEYGEEAPQVIFRLRANISFMWMISQRTSSSHKLCNPLMYYTPQFVQPDAPASNSKWRTVGADGGGGGGFTSSGFSNVSQNDG